MSKQERLQEQSEEEEAEAETPLVDRIRHSLEVMQGVIRDVKPGEVAAIAKVKPKVDIDDEDDSIINQALQKATNFVYGSYAFRRITSGKLPTLNMPIGVWQELMAMAAMASGEYSTFLEMEHNEAKNEYNVISWFLPSQDCSAGSAVLTQQGAIDLAVECLDRLPRMYGIYHIHPGYISNRSRHTAGFSDIDYGVMRTWVKNAPKGVFIVSATNGGARAELCTRDEEGNNLLLDMNFNVVMGVNDHRKEELEALFRARVSEHLYVYTSRPRTRFSNEPVDLSSWRSQPKINDIWDEYDDWNGWGDWGGYGGSRYVTRNPRGKGLNNTPPKPHTSKHNAKTDRGARGFDLKVEAFQIGDLVTFKRNTRTWGSHIWDSEYPVINIRMDNNYIKVHDPDGKVGTNGKEPGWWYPAYELLPALKPLPKRPEGSHPVQIALEATAEGITDLGGVAGCHQGLTP